MTLRKRRDLPLPGTVLVREGDIVSSNTIVAKAEREGELRIVKVAEILGLSPKEALGCIKVAVGSHISERDTVAELRGLWGLFRTRVEAPTAGLVEFVSEATGHVGIRGPSSTLELSAYITGVVTQIDAGRGIVIETEATFIQGIFGVGGERSGVVRMLPVKPDEVVQVVDIPSDCAGAVLVGGHSPTLDALRKAQSLGAVGFVTGSIDDITLQGFVGYDIGIALTGDEPIAMTVIITEGFGALPMNPRIAEMISACSGAQVSINGATQVRAGALRPEIITAPSVDRISLATESASEQLGQGLVVGQAVRMIRVPYFGMYGTIVELPRELVRIETGAFARVAKVSLQGLIEQVIVPRANLEIVS
jgi:hypothetical protein